MTERDFKIMKKVYEKYPKTNKEKTCLQEKNRLQNLRELYKRRLESEYDNFKIQYR